MHLNKDKVIMQIETNQNKAIYINFEIKHHMNSNTMSSHINRQPNSHLILNVCPEPTIYFNNRAIYMATETNIYIAIEI